MPEELIQNKLAEYEQALENRGAQVYVFRLYVTGASPQSLQAIENLKQLCDENFPGRYELDVFDIYQQPELAKQAQLVAAPTLIKDRPLPVRRLIGNLSNTEETLKRLDAIPEGKS
ncbi:MAG TPA: circadian clock KaiB family protein [Candidatus Binatia bacterium]|jgi:circadian clock protein KaiB